MSVGTILEEDAVKQMYQRLLSSHNKSKTEDETIIKDIEGSRMFQNAFCCNDPIYQQQINNILASKPDVINPGTVASYLYGCFQPEVAVEISCTPECATGLKNPKLKACEIASYEKRGKLTKVNNIGGEEANIFISANDRITRDDIIQLRKDGIKAITLYNQDTSGISYILGQSENIETINTTEVTTTTTTNDTSGWIWAWIIVAIVLVIILAILFFR